MDYTHLYLYLLYLSVCRYYRLASQTFTSSQYANTVIHRLQITLLKWQSLNLICKWYSITQTYFWFCPSFSFYYLQLALLMDVMARFHLLPMQAFELLLLFVSGVSMTSSTTSKIYFNVSTHGKFIYIGWNMYFSLYLNRAWASSSHLRLVGNAYIIGDYLQHAYKWTFGNSWDFIQQFSRKLTKEV